MAKLSGVVLTITRTFIVASALAMAVALPMLSNSAVAQNDIRTSTEDGGDTFVERTYDDKTGKLLKVVRDTETRDPNDQTNIWRKVTTKKYDQGKKPHYETTVDAQEIALDGRKRVLRKRTHTSTTYTKTKQRDLVSEVKEEKELVALDANGVPIYEGSRITTWAQGVTPEKNEVWDEKTRKWVRVRPGSIPKHLEAQRQKRLNRTKTAREKLKEEAALKDKRMRKEDIKKNKNKREETNKARRQNRAATPKSKAEEDRIVEADEGGMLVGKSLKLADLEGCGVEFQGLQFDKLMGFVSTPCPGLIGGRVATQSDYLTHCKSYKDFNGYCGPPGSGTEKRMEKSGVYGMPLSVFCLSLHYGILSKNASYNSVVRQGNLASVYKYNNSNRKLECFYISKVQSKSLYLDYKNLKEGPGPATPVAQANPQKDCKLGGGLLGAMNCVTKRIEGAGGSVNKTPDSASSTDPSAGTTTTSVKNPDGSHTVTRTDRDGKVLSKKTVGKSPASASSIDKKTGVTSASVRNPDGTRTVTKTDKDGNILSRKRVGKSPDSASSTVLDIGGTTRSVANPDGSRTVTKTDKDGNILSREKVR